MFKLKDTPLPSLSKLVVESEGQQVYDGLTRGDKFQKVMKTGKTKPYSVALDSTCHTILLGKKKKIDITKIEEIRVGHLTEAFLKHSDKFDEECSFSIVYHNNESGAPSIVSLVADSSLIRQWWDTSLQFLLGKVGDMKGEAYSLEVPWNVHSKGKETISWRQALTLLRALNLRTDGATVKRMIRQVDTDGDRRLNFPEFVNVIRRLRSRTIIGEIFEKFQEDELIGPVHLQKFLSKEQGQEVSLEEAERLIRLISFDDATLDEVEFELFLTSELNEIYDPKKLAIHHDMTQPLSHYYIDSSHNTYLTGDQLKSDSSIEMYIRAFRMGCRCVELDCWDGKGGEPEIYHGYTLTSKILFRDIISVIKSHGFSTSAYPVILSFENHCSKKQQVKMAQILVEILGDMLAPPPGNVQKLPSPEQLKYKVLIKGKMTSSSTTEDMEEIEEDGLSGEAQATLRSVAGGAASSRGSSAAKKEKPKKEKIAEELSKLTYLKAEHFHSFDDSHMNWTGNMMSSFSEPKTWKVFSRSEAGFEDFRRYNEKNLSRIYPKGTRFDSSNYDPILPWIAGCQIVALNYQTDSPPMWVNYGRFRENGNSGYNLRPKSSRTQAGTIRPAGSKWHTVKIRLFSGRLFPKTERECCDPYVSMHLFEGKEESTKEVTPVVQNNGFNPDWDFLAKFKITDSANSFLVFKVVDDDVGKNSKIGQACIPIECLRPGFRVIHLFDDKFKKIQKGMTNLFCHVDLE